MSDDLLQSSCLSKSASSIPDSLPADTIQDLDAVGEFACSHQHVSQLPQAHEKSKSVIDASATTSISGKLKRISSRTVESEESKYVNETRGLLLAGLVNAHGTGDADSLMAQANLRKSHSDLLDNMDCNVEDSADGDALLARVWKSFLQVCYAITLGALAGLVTILFHAATSKFEEYFRLGASAAAENISLSANVCLRGMQFFSTCPGIAFGIFMTLGTTLSAFVAAWICQHIVPECIGGGTIATKICLAVGAPIPLRVGVCRLLLSTLYVGTGNALGIEAPTLHVCAAIASAFHRRASSISDCINRCFSRSHPMPQLFENDGLAQAVVLGCAAGLSAAFGSPLAGITYAVEEYVDVRQTGVVTALLLVSCVSATLVRRSIESHTGTGPLSISAQTAQDIVESSTISASAGVETWILFAATVGISLGIVSLIVMSCVLHVRSRLHGRISRSCEIFVSAMGGLAAGLLGCVAYTFTSCDTSWGFGKMERIFAIGTMCDMPSDVTSLQEVGVILILTGTKLIAFLLCFAFGGSGGVLMPSLFIGGLIGKCIGHAFSSLDSEFPHAGTVLGMAAFFSANMRLPLTGATVVLEYAMVNEAYYNARLVSMIPAAAALGTCIASMYDPLSVHERMMLQDGINPLTLGRQIELMVKGTDTLMVKGPDSDDGSDDNAACPVRIGSISSGESRASRLSLTGVVNVETGSSMRMLAAAHRRSVMPMPPEARGRLPSRSSIPEDGKRSVLSVPEDLLHASNFQAPLRQARFDRLFSRVADTVQKARCPVAQKPGGCSNIDVSKMLGITCPHSGKNSIASCKIDRASILSCLPENGVSDGAPNELQAEVDFRARSDGTLSFGKRESRVAPSCGTLFGNPVRDLSKSTNRMFLSTSCQQRASVSLSTDISSELPNPRLLGRGHADIYAEEEPDKDRVSSKLNELALGSDTTTSAVSDVRGPAHSRGRSMQHLIEQ